MNNIWDEEMTEEETKAYMDGFSVCMMFPKPYDGGMNPYSKTIVGVKNNAAWREGYIDARRAQGNHP